MNNREKSRKISSLVENTGKTETEDDVQQSSDRTNTHIGVVCCFDNKQKEEARSRTHVAVTHT